MAYAQTKRHGKDHRLVWLLEAPLRSGHTQFIRAGELQQTDQRLLPDVFGVGFGLFVGSQRVKSEFGTQLCQHVRVLRDHVGIDRFQDQLGVAIPFSRQRAGVYSPVLGSHLLPVVGPAGYR